MKRWSLILVLGLLSYVAVVHAKSSIVSEPEGQKCIVDQNAIEDIEKQKTELKERITQLEQREAELKLKETAAQEELKKLEEIKKDIKSQQTKILEKNEEQVSKLVQTFEKMSPDSVAQILVQIDEGLAVAAIGKLSTERLAKVLAKMKTADSSRLTELLVLGRTSVPRAKQDAAAPKESTDSKGKAAAEKGGAKVNG